MPVKHTIQLTITGYQRDELDRVASTLHISKATLYRLALDAIIAKTINLTGSDLFNEFIRLRSLTDSALGAAIVGLQEDRPQAVLQHQLTAATDEDS